MPFDVREVSETSESVELGEKLWLTADRERLVPDGHREAAFLFGTPGKRVSREDAIRLGLVEQTDEEKARAEVEATATAAALALAEEAGVDLAEVEGTGAEGRVTKADVAAAASDDATDDEPEPASEPEPEKAKKPASNKQRKKASDK